MLRLMSVVVSSVLAAIVPGLLAGFLAAAIALGAPAETSVDFQSQVRPILSNNCFHCHGPDPATRMAGLRLDTREAGFASRDNGTPIVPGDPAASLIYRRIIEKNTALRMPPEYSHKKLTGGQIETIRLWIEQGARWSDHWAFIPPRRGALPAVKNQKWIRSPIDRFVLARLEAAGLEPSPEAGRRRLIRRLTLDLTGLPPEPRDVESFAADPSPGAYEKLVDRLLGSPAYGEHRARYWLDAARYADTHGLHIDNYREMWPYRDWVIQAFNRNLGFDQFTIEQLAGDLLESPAKDQLIATGFHRCNITTNEGGVIDDEVAAIYAKDRVDTTGMVWLGLTIGCATCHDHKFDPIKQRDFYSMAAFFRNTTQHPRDGNIYDTPPVIVVPAQREGERWEQLRPLIASQQKRLQEVRSNAQPKLNSWLRSRRQLRTVKFDRSEILSLSMSGTLALETAPKGVRLETPAEVSISGSPSAVNLEGEKFLSISGFKSISSGRPFTVSIRFKVPKVKGRRVLVTQLFEREGEKRRGWRINMQDGLPGAAFFGDRGRELGIQTTGDRKVKPGEWHHLSLTYDGRRGRTGLELYLDGERLPKKNSGRGLKLIRGEILTSEPLLIGARDNEEEMDDFLEGSVADFRILRREVSESEARLLSLWDALESSQGKQPADLSKRETQALAEYFLVRRHKPYQKAMRRLQGLRAERRAIRLRSPVTHVMNERKDSKPMAHILHRGMYDQPREEVEPDTPAVLGSLPASLPRNRLGLAKWLVSEANPLTARVTVNRFWQELFGTGLVKTAGDFGSQGEAPSHPRLLDWLAVEFRESGWDIKRLMKTMVTSATYRQSAVMTETALAADPENRLLSRGPRYRMEAEMVRDYALAASGLLAHRVGGPSVKPYQPDRIWETVAMDNSNTRFYKRDSGERLYRRSLYTFWKRTAPPPAMTIFNAPSREFCTVQRERTNTPLQALLTMNGTQFFEAARSLAENAMRAEKKFDARLGYMTSRLLARAMEEKERAVVGDAYADYLRFYDSHPAEADAALSVGESKPGQKLGKAEFAALTMVANQLMNLDEVLNK